MEFSESSTNIADVNKHDDNKPVAISLNNNRVYDAVAYVSPGYGIDVGADVASLSTSYSGTYYGIDNCVELKDNIGRYKWLAGTFNNTKVSDDGAIILDDESIGYGEYITPIMCFEDKYMSSSFLMDYDMDGAVNNVEVYNKASNIPPENFRYLWWKGIYEYNIDNGNMELFVTQDNVYHFLFDDRRMRLYMSDDNNSVLRTYELLTDYNAHNSSSSSKYRFNVNMEFDKGHNIWGYGTASKYLIRTDTDFNIITEIYKGGNDFVHDFSVEKDGYGIWYIDTLSNSLEHLDSEGNTLNSTILYSVGALTSTYDNGCWVTDDEVGVILRLDYEGNLLYNIPLPKRIYTMLSEEDGGFWYASGDEVVRVDDQGNSIETFLIPGIERFVRHNSLLACYAKNRAAVYIIDREKNELISKLVSDIYTYRSIPAVADISYEHQLDYLGTTKIVPKEYDPIWRLDSDIEWRPIYDGYYLSKYNYHQFKIVLRGHESPKIRSVKIPYCLKTAAVPAGDNKDVYLKVNPTRDSFTEDSYDFKLNCTWKNINGQL